MRGGYIIQDGFSGARATACHSGGHGRKLRTLIQCGDRKGRFLGLVFVFPKLPFPIFKMGEAKDPEE
jgi:hypothetical protein